MEFYDVIKPLIFNDEKFNKHFADFVIKQMNYLTNDALKYTIADFIIQYCSIEIGPSKLHKLLNSLNSNYINSILQYKDYPDFKNFIASVPKNWKNSGSFSIIEGLIILEKYGENENIGINERYTAYLAEKKANKQNNTFIQRDLNGLLGVSMKYKKDVQPPKDYESSISIWTVKSK